jgi:DUF2946 family protein
MRLRAWATIVAVLGVLLHVGALVRHHGVVLSGHLLEQVLAADLATFCHGGADVASGSPAGLPETPKPSDAQSGCPVCSGQAPAFALVAPAYLEARERFAVTTGWTEPERSNPTLRHAVCPPARGPPASALSA